MPPPAPNPPQQKKKGSSGCLIALGVVGGIFLLLALVGGILIWRVLKTDEAQAIIGAVGDATKAVQKGLNAPGTEQLRQAGCQEAMVMDVGDFMDIAKRFVKDGGADGVKIDNEKLHTLMVTCSVGYGEKVLSCDALAVTYVKAVGGRAEKNFAMLVQRQGGQKPLCQGEYDPQGRRVGGGAAEAPADEQ
jgi:hypothetical protein